ncbi:MAG: iron-containing alcohol dehydrogenase [Promethearchaeota archaeon]
MEEQEEKAWHEDPIVRRLIPLLGARATKSLRNSFLCKEIYGGKSGLSTVAHNINSMFEPNEKKILIIADDFTSKSFADIIIKEMEPLEFKCKVWDGVKPDVPIETIEEGFKICEQFHPKVFIAVGGGSVIDSAKALLIRYSRPDVSKNLRQISVMDPPSGMRKKVKIFIAIPTTSGTGAECTSAIVISDTKRKPSKKFPILHPETIPDAVVLDTDFVKDLPPFLTAATGLDALSHSVGGYLTYNGTPYTDAINLKVIEEIIKYLPRAVKYGGKDLEAREHMQWASSMAGIGFGNSNIGVGISHALGHSFGAIYHAHHGLSVGLFTPYQIRYTAGLTGKWIDLCPLFNVSTKDKNKEEIIKELIFTVRKFIQSVGGITAVKDCKNPVISKEDYMNKLDVLANYADTDLSTFGSIRAINESIYKKILTYAWEGKDYIF